MVDSSLLAALEAAEKRALTAENKLQEARKILDEIEDLFPWVLPTIMSEHGTTRWDWPGCAELPCAQRKLYVFDESGEADGDK